MLIPLARAAAAAVLLFPLAAQSAATPPDAVAGADPAGSDVVAADADTWRPHRAIEVLYAGWPGGSREVAFRAFLERHFDRVTVIGLAQLTKATATEHDVVIADWASQYGKDGYPARENSLTSAPVSLADDFDVPVIAMDYVATNLRRNGKLDWL